MCPFHYITFFSVHQIWEDGISAGDITGFDITTKNGSISCKSAAKSAELSIGNISVKREMLLVSGKGGIIIGSEKVSYNGKDCCLSGSFEFEISGNNIVKKNDIEIPSGFKWNKTDNKYYPSY